MSLIHATGVFFADKGLLLKGPSGSGKSDLALRLMALGAELVGDDYLEVSCGKDGRLTMIAPSNIAGKIEVRNVGILAVPHRGKTEIDLVLDLVLLGDIKRLDRLPEPGTFSLEGRAVPCLGFYAFEASAPEKIRAAINILFQKY
ncbi:MAG: hypothetical protein JKY45_01685 [Emcibacter sp.]|nr:hypothetical protein [Emcibacter sp.]